MSLSSFLERPEVKEHFKKHFPVSEIIGKVKAPIRVPSTNLNPGVVGTAFDYLLRFAIEENRKKVHKTEWVAEKAIRHVKEFWPDDLKVAQTILREARQRHSKFLQSGNLEDDLIKSTIKIGFLEATSKSGRNYVRERVRLPNVKEVRSLYELAIESDIFFSRRRCYLNPGFGEASDLIGGADADLIIGDTLIELKTEKHMKIDRGLYQLIGYYLLSEIAGEPTKINNIAIYFARYGVLCSMPIEIITNRRRFSSFVKWFRSEAKLEGERTRNRKEVSLLAQIELFTRGNSVHENMDLRVVLREGETLSTRTQTITAGVIVKDEWENLYLINVDLKESRNQSLKQWSSYIKSKAVADYVKKYIEKQSLKDGMKYEVGSEVRSVFLFKAKP